MKELLVVLIQYFNCFLISIVVLAVMPNAFAGITLSDEDKHIAEMAKVLAVDSANWSLPVNPYASQAQHHAKQILDTTQGNITANQSPLPSAKKFHGRTIIFASMSLGKQALDDILFTSATMKGVVVAFRGVVDERNFARSILELQKLASSQSPVANIIIDPTLFTKFRVKTVPTIVYLNKDETQELARVGGLSRPDWMYDKVNSGKSGNFGIRGPVQDILERDLIQVLKGKVDKIDWASKKEAVISRYWQNNQYLNLPSATQPRLRYLDPSIIVAADIKDADGLVLVPKGSRINPLKHLPFTQAILIFDALNEDEVKIVRAKVESLKSQYQRITLIVTRLDPVDGSKSYTDITDSFNAPVFTLTPDITSRFKVEFTPTVITANETNFLVQELAAKDDTK